MNIPIKITPEILKLIAEIDEFKGRWSYAETLVPEKLNTLKKYATIASIGSSTRIEGVTLSDTEIEKLLSDLHLQTFRSRDEEEVKGYADALQIIFDAYQDIPFTENYLKQIHSIVLKHSSKDSGHKGEYKKVSNNVAMLDAQGQAQAVIFETATPFDTPRLMNELLSVVNQALGNGSLHPLLVLAYFVVHFLAIHPFQDGNGRVSRILTTYLLLRAGYRYVPYVSLEHIIEENKNAYYVALRQAQKNIRTTEEDLHPWIIFFLKTLHKQITTLENTLAQELSLRKLPVLAEKILQTVKQRGRITNAEIVQLHKANRNTVKLTLSNLVLNNYLQKHSQGKGTWYSLP